MAPRAQHFDSTRITNANPIRQRPNRAISRTVSRPSFRPAEGSLSVALFDASFRPERGTISSSDAISTSGLRTVSTTDTIPTCSGPESLSSACTVSCSRTSPISPSSSVASAYSETISQLCTVRPVSNILRSSESLRGCYILWMMF
jgi:hypothetical protein